MEIEAKLNWGFNICLIYSLRGNIEAFEQKIDMIKLNTFTFFLDYQKGTGQ